MQNLKSSDLTPRMRAIIGAMRHGAQLLGFTVGRIWLTTAFEAGVKKKTLAALVLGGWVRPHFKSHRSVIREWVLTDKGRE